MTIIDNIQNFFPENTGSAVLSSAVVSFCLSALVSKETSSFMHYVKNGAKGASMAFIYALATPIFKKYLAKKNCTRLGLLQETAKTFIATSIPIAIDSYLNSTEVNYKIIAQTSIVMNIFTDVMNSFTEMLSFKADKPIDSVHWFLIV